MISHVSFGVNDLAASVAFYDAVLAPIGIGRVWLTDDGAGYGLPGEEDLLALKLQPVRAVPRGRGFTSPSPRPAARRSTDSIRRPWQQAAAMPDHLVCGPTMVRTTTRPSCSIPMATSWKR